MTEPLAKPSTAPEKCCPCQKHQGGAGNKKAEQVNDQNWKKMFVQMWLAVALPLKSVLTSSPAQALSTPKFCLQGDQPEPGRAPAPQIWEERPHWASGGQGCPASARSSCSQAGGSGAAVSCSQLLQSLHLSVGSRALPLLLLLVLVFPLWMTATTL